MVGPSFRFRLIELVVQEPDTADGLASAFEAMQRERAQALIVQQNPFATDHGKQTCMRQMSHEF